MSTAKKPLVLLIMDGWGYRPNMPDNAVSNANTPEDFTKAKSKIKEIYASKS